MSYKSANQIQDLQYFGEFGGVNPSISDSSTYTFLSAKTMFDTFEGNADGCVVGSSEGILEGIDEGTMDGFSEGIVEGY